MMKVQGWIRVVALVTAASVSGCYRYVPAEAAAVPPGEQVRLFVTRAALAPLNDLPVDAASPVLAGTLIRSEPASVVLRVPVTARQQGFGVQVLGQDVIIARDQIVQMERRELNGLATGALTIGGTALLTGAVIMIIQGARQGDLLPGSSDVELAPRFSVPFP